MPAPAAHRPFTLLDMVILVFGCALGLAPWVSAPSVNVLALVWTLCTGLRLVGPLVIWRGWALTGRGVACAGEGMWLAVWPAAVLSGQSMFVRVVDMDGDVVIVAWLMELCGVVLVGLLGAYARAHPRVDARPSRPWTHAMGFVVGIAPMPGTFVLLFLVAGVAC